MKLSYICGHYDVGPPHMSRRKKPVFRCLACHMRQELCVCPEIKSCREYLDKKQSAHQILILMHHRERHLTTNTGRLAALTIPNCQIHYRGLPLQPLNCAELLSESRETLLLFPSEDAVELNSEFLAQISKPITLVVPDGSWRQAYKVAKREEALSQVRRVVLPIGKTSQYKLRREPKEDGLATFEAIARAWGMLESSEAQTKLESVFLLMVERTLQSRGYSNPATRPTFA